MPSPVRDQKNPLRGNTGWTSANELYLMNLITPEVFFFFFHWENEKKAHSPR